MKISLKKLLFSLLSIFLINYSIFTFSGNIWVNAVIGLTMGFFSYILFSGFEAIFNKINLRSLNIALLGFFLGYIIYKAAFLTTQTLLDAIHLSNYLNSSVYDILKIFLFTLSGYLGIKIIKKSSSEFYISIPFVRLTPSFHKRKEIIIDSSVLLDPRIIDFMATGIINHQLIIPRFLIKKLHEQSENEDEILQSKAKRSLETLSKIEEIPNIGLRYDETDFAEIKDLSGKLIRLARLIDANLLTSDISRIEMLNIEGVRIINLHVLANALKPLMQTGETIKIKIQRYGKEPRQGVGYLDDGTMVVVNGGGDFIGDSIEAIVLSVKHTSSGRIIFCNAQEELCYE